MRNEAIFIFAFLLLVGASTCVASSGYVVADVEYIRTHDAAFLPSWAPPIFFFTIKGSDTLGSCPKWNDHISFLSENDASYSMVLAAFTGGKKIAVRWDDAVMKNGYCKATYITIGDPPPAY